MTILLGRVLPALAVLLAASCTSVRFVPIEDRPEHVAWREEGAAFPELGLVVAPVRVDVEGPGKVPPNALAAAAAVFNPGAFRDRLADVLEDCAGFAWVDYVDAADAAGQDREAREANADLVLSARVTVREVSYQGTNRWFIPNFFLAGYGWVPHWWVADEDYQARLVLECSLRSAHTGVELIGMHVQGDCRAALDEFAKGWAVWGILLNWPGKLGPSQWAGVAGRLLPLAAEDAAFALARYLREDLPYALDSPDGRAAMTKTLAVVAGVAHYRDPSLPAADYALEDADAMATHFRGRWSVRDWNIHVLKDFQVTSAALRAAMDDVAARARPQDRVVLYFAGLGGGDGTPGRTWIFPQDASAADPGASGISVEDLVAWIARLQASEVYLVLDASLGGGGTRSLPGAGAPPDGARPADLFARLPRGAAALLAARPGEGANPMASEGRGLFTYWLLRGAEHLEADADGDGRVTVRELADFLALRVGDQAVYLNARQQPDLVAAPSAAARVWPAGGR